MRQQRLVELRRFLLQSGFTSYPEIAMRFDTSVMTARRDIRELVSRGLAAPRPGGAFAGGGSHGGDPRIARTSWTGARMRDTLLELVQPGMSIGILAGVHAVPIASSLAHVMDITVVTNSVPVSEILYTENRTLAREARVVLTPGLCDSAGGLTGALCTAALTRLSLDITFVSVHNSKPYRGSFSDSLEAVEVARAFRNASFRIVGFVDIHNKSGSSVAIVDAIKPGDTLVCDSEMPELGRTALLEAGYDIIVAA